MNAASGAYVLTYKSLTFQQTMVASSGAIVLPLLVAGLVCADQNDTVKLNLIGTTLVMVGVATILQTLIGVRLPLLQGPSFAFLPAIMAMMTLPEFKCPLPGDLQSNSSESVDNPWESRLQAVTASFILSTTFTETSCKTIGTRWIHSSIGCANAVRCVRVGRLSRSLYRTAHHRSVNGTIITRDRRQSPRTNVDALDLSSVGHFSMLADVTTF